MISTKNAKGHQQWRDLSVCVHCKCKSALCNVSSGKGDCPESFYSVGDKHTNLHQFRAALGYIRAAYAIRHRGGQAYLFTQSPSLAPSVHSQCKPHTRTHTHTRQAQFFTRSEAGRTQFQTSTPCMDEASPSPQWNKPLVGPTGSVQLPPSTKPQPRLL